MAEKIEVVKVSTDLINRCVEVSRKIAELEEQEKALKAEISKMAGIQEGSIKIEDVTGATATVSLVSRAQWNQEALAEILRLHPVVASEYFVQEWKPVDQKAVDRRIESSTSPIWKQIAGALEKKSSTTIRLKGGK